MPMDRITPQEFHATAISEIEQCGLIVCPTTRAFKKEQGPIVFLTGIFGQDGVSAVSFSELEVLQNECRKSAEVLIAERVQSAIFSLRDHLTAHKAT